eukprot:TRINITY_DN24723_c0_g1_i1.p1 TRINITY_DN24723_c0_g1~~TRINITY_DN24723_c0_g1_i1.p1  ORF type:complete len:1032 (+),score=260.71 TRINITY_DN24723_c0_g1_i1:26-3097(+)
MAARAAELLEERLQAVLQREPGGSPRRGATAPLRAEARRLERLCIKQRDELQELLATLARGRGSPVPAAEAVLELSVDKEWAEGTAAVELDATHTSRALTTAESMVSCASEASAAASAAASRAAVADGQVEELRYQLRMEEAATRAAARRHGELCDRAQSALDRAADEERRAERLSQQLSKTTKAREAALSRARELGAVQEKAERSNAQKVGKLAEGEAKRRTTLQQAASARRALVDAVLTAQGQRQQWAVERTSLRCQAAVLSATLGDLSRRLRGEHGLREHVRDAADALGEVSEREAAIAAAKWRAHELQRFEAAAQDRGCAEAAADAAQAAELRAAAERLSALPQGGDEEDEDLAARCWAGAGGLAPTGAPVHALASCHPDPCPVGSELCLVVTVCDAQFQPVAGVASDELTVHSLEMHSQPQGSAERLGPGLLVTAVQPAAADGVYNPSAECSACGCFTAAFRPSSEGVAGFRVSFRGGLSTALAQVPAPLRRGPGAGMPPAPVPPLTVSCGPDGVGVGEEATVVAVLRCPGSLVPAAAGSADPALRVLLAMAAAGSPVPTLERPGPAAVFVGRFTLGAAPGGAAPQRLMGCEVTLPGVGVARGAARVASGGSAAATATVACFPNPCVAGGTVQCTITLRDQRLAPLPAARGEQMRVSAAAVGHVEQLQQPAPLGGPHAVYSVSFVALPPDHSGCAGVDVYLNGSDAAAGRGSVEVLPAGRCCPSRTEVQLITPRDDAAAPRDVAHAIIITRDEEGREAPGPGPGALRPSAHGGGAHVSTVSRLSSSESRYVAPVELPRRRLGATAAPGSVAVTHDGHTAEVSLAPKPPGDPSPRRRAASRRLLAAFCRDPLQPGDVVNVVISVAAEAESTGAASGSCPADPIREMRRGAQRPVSPRTHCRLRAVRGAEVVLQPRPTPAQGVWVARVRVSDLPGVAVVAASAEPYQPVQASAPVLRRGRHGAAELAAVVSQLQETLWTLREDARQRQAALCALTAWEEDLARREGGGLPPPPLPDAAFP